MTATGTVEECADQLRALRDEGVNHVALRLASWRQHEQLDLLIGKVLPAFLATSQPVVRVKGRPSHEVAGVCGHAVGSGARQHGLDEPAGSPGAGCEVSSSTVR